MSTAESQLNVNNTKENLLKQLNWRYAVKKFDAAKKISDADYQTLAESLVLAPTSYGLQPIKFIVVTDAAVKEKLLPHAYGQSQITDCSHLVVIVARQNLTEEYVNHYFERIVEVRGTPREALADFEATVQGFAKNLSSSGNGFNWSARQGYIALGFLMETAALLNIDACPMEGFQPEGFDDVLGLKEEGLGAVVLCPLGYRDAENDYLADQKKVRFPHEELIQIV